MIKSNIGDGPVPAASNGNGNGNGNGQTLGAAADASFLGEEFLTWLWFQLETEGGDFDLGEPLGEVGVAIEDHLVFAPRDDDETEQTLRGGLPTRTAEAATALRNGRRLRRAKLVLARGEETFGVTVDGPTMNLMSVRLPDDDPDAIDFDERSRDRMQRFLELRDLVMGIYTRFLQQRLQAEYLRTGAEQQANWMARR